MSEFQPVYPETINLDPYKRVKYSNGLVLGVDEFEQEQLYLLTKDQLHNRSLHGYGTVCGLNVTAREEDGVWELVVSPGIAVDKTGRDVRVPQAQCADLSVWLQRNTDTITQWLTDQGIPIVNPIALTLHVVLCYDQCATDYVPVPSGPCQSLDKTSVASRYADNFKLQLQLDAPEQEEEDAIEFLLQLLADIEISNAPGGLTVSGIEEIIRAFEEPATSLHMSEADAPAIIDAALRVWVTEVRPGLLPDGRNCVAGPPRDECISLGQVQLQVEDTASELGYRLVSGSDPTVEQAERPILLQSRLLQEFMYNRLALQSLSSSSGGGSSSGGSSSSGPDPADLVHISGDETIEGEKTFSAPVSLADGGRVEKTISLPAFQAHNGRGAAKGLFNSVLPAMHFMTTGTNAFAGEVYFSIPIPNDIDYGEGMQFRLIWGFQGSPEPSGIEFNWQVSAHFYRANDAVGTLETIAASVSEENERRNDVLVTEYFDFDGDVEITDEHCYGVIKVSIEDPGTAIPQVYLLQVELRYLANRLGGVVS
ncbi:MAG TPA: hypothetical protein VF268_07725 [Gammaproteobacteria bacterium]